jgi:deoxyribodipyrimidine photo-lyase
MQQSQRAEFNPALEYAVAQANRIGKGVVVGFGLTDDYPEANLRHFTFMLEGLRETAKALEKRGIGMAARLGPPPEVALALGRDACLIVCDRGYLRHQRSWRDQVARQAGCRVVQVESDVVVPVETASGKAEIGARTLRPKICRHLAAFLVNGQPQPVQVPASAYPTENLDLNDTASILKNLSIDRRVGPVSFFFKGGTSEAKRRFADFLSHRLARYAAHHNQPQTGDVSQMGPYLHFGQISPVYLALAVNRAIAPQSAKDAFAEELIVRRELACNFTEYTADYDAYDCIPAWARQSLAEHQSDRRAFVYTPEQLETAQTHDPYWNAAMREMVCTGFMHNYMRMYWGKKILEWSPSPRQAYALTLLLNNRYFLDGRDPNSYAGVAWVYGVHDRAWPRRAIFGKVRSMTASGLERKCDIKAYVQKVDALCGLADSPTIQ